MLARIKSSIAYRAKWARLGVIYAKQPKLNSVLIAGRSVRLSLPENERAVHEYEFGKIVFEDCYRLSEIKNAETVLDIGANIGLFTLAARNRFPRATIHSYEPNPALAPYFTRHCEQVGATAFPVAVGSKDDQISLDTPSDGSLHSVSRSGGLIPQIAFGKAVERLGTVDLFKLDCEGAEWDIFTDPAPWQRVRNLAMEFHLWAKPGSSTDTVRAALRALDFQHVEVEITDQQWGLAFAAR